LAAISKSGQRLANSEEVLFRLKAGLHTGHLRSQREGGIYQPLNRIIAFNPVNPENL
jgi:hypothetical protein